MKRKLRSSIAPEDTYKMWPVTCHVHVADLKETAQVPPLPTVLLMPILDTGVMQTASGLPKKSLEERKVSSEGGGGEVGQ